MLGSHFLKTSVLAGSVTAQHRVTARFCSGKELKTKSGTAGKKENHRAHGQCFHGMSGRIDFCIANSPTAKLFGVGTFPCFFCVRNKNADSIRRDQDNHLPSETLQRGSQTVSERLPHSVEHKPMQHTRKCRTHISRAFEINPNKRPLPG